MTFKDFIKSKYFFIQLFLAAVLAIIIFWLSLRFLDIYTLHGRTITVPDLEGLYEEDVKTLLDDLNLNYTIHDSIYDETRKRGTVAAQEPVAETDVKRRRTIYLTMVAKLPEMVTVPDLTDLTLRQAIALLNNHGLKVGNLEYAPSIAKNAVIKQKYKHGTIKPGTMLETGTPIDLVLGDGMSESHVPAPFIIGLTRQEARMQINRASLNLGNEIYLDDDSVNVKVYKQEPDPLKDAAKLKLGSTVNIYYRSADEFDFDGYLEQILSVDVPILYGKPPEEARKTIEQSFLKVGNEIFEKEVSEENARVYKQEPDYFDVTSVRRGTEINLWYRALKDFDDE